jgi:hypothetical protein
MTRKRHQYREGEPTKEFGELTYKEQAQSMNMTKLNLKRQEETHRRKGREEGRGHKTT